MELKRDLEESRNSWQESANHDKWQAMASFIVANCGVALTSVGAIGTVEGEPVLGLPAMAIGASLVIYGYKEAKSEISSAMKMQGRAAVRQHELQNLDTPSE